MAKKPHPKRRVLRRSIKAIMGAVLLAAALTPWYWPSKQQTAMPSSPGKADLTPLQTMRMNRELYTNEIDISALMTLMGRGQAQAVGLESDRVLVLTHDGERFFVKDTNSQLGAHLIKSIEHTLDLGASSIPAMYFLAEPNKLNPSGQTWNNALRATGNAAMLVLYALLIVFLIKLLRDYSKGAHSPLAGKTDLRFSDVIGVREAKASLQDVVQYLRDPQRYKQLGARPPCGILLLGGPGVGKTLLAKALAGECDASFISASGSDFTSKYVGVGVQKVKKLFETARKNAPGIVFIDEIDGIARRTNNGSGAAESENNRIVNQFLVEMDGFSKNDGVVVIGATNLVEHLDPALCREGRFDRRVQVLLPDLQDRALVLEHYARDITLNNEQIIDFQQLARLTTGFSPATLAYVVNNAALIAARHDAQSVGMTELLEAIETAHMGELNGAQRALSPPERYRIAVHEAGHAIVAVATGCGTVEKVTILPRGGALGVTLVTQPQDRMLHLKTDMEKLIQMLLAGRNAEQAVFGEASSGAAHDLQECSRIAMAMVSKYGFGLNGSLFHLDALQRELAGPYVKESIDQAKAILEKMNKACQQILAQHADALAALTQELLVKETVSGERVNELILLQRERAQIAKAEAVAA